MDGFKTLTRLPQDALLSEEPIVPIPGSPPDRKLRELKKSVRGGERNAVIGADRPRQTPLSEKALKGQLCAIRFQRFAQQQISRSMIGNSQRIAVALSPSWNSPL